MASHSSTTHQTSCYFVEHVGRLSSSLDFIIAEANASTDPNMASGYMELIAILRDLLSQAQAFSTQGPEQLRGRWGDIQMFASRVTSIQNAIGNWNPHLRPAIELSPCKKRGRSETMDGETAAVPDLKRSRSQDQDAAMKMDGFTAMVPLRPANPNTINSPTQWRMEM